MRWVVAALTVVILAGAGIWFATSVGWDDSIPAGTFRLPGATLGLRSDPRGGADLASCVGRLRDLDGRPPGATRGERVVVHHRLFYPSTYTLVADDGTHVADQPSFDLRYH